MSGLDDFFDKAKEVSQTAGRKTSEYIEVSKLKIKASQLQTKIRQKYEDLGSSVYNAVKAKSEGTEFILDYVDEINSLKHELRAINEKIDFLLGRNICPLCKSVNKKNVKFCSNCGAELNPQDEVMGV